MKIVYVWPGSIEKVSLWEHDPGLGKPRWLERNETQGSMPLAKFPGSVRHSMIFLRYSIRQM